MNFQKFKTHFGHFKLVYKNFLPQFPRIVSLLFSKFKAWFFLSHLQHSISDDNNGSLQNMSQGQNVDFFQTFVSCIFQYTRFIHNHATPSSAETYNQNQSFDFSSHFPVSYNLSQGTKIADEIHPNLFLGVLLAMLIIASHSFSHSSSV